MRFRLGRGRNRVAWRGPRNRQRVVGCRAVHRRARAHLAYAITPVATVVVTVLNRITEGNATAAVYARMLGGANSQLRTEFKRQSRAALPEERESESQG